MGNSNFIPALPFLIETLLQDKRVISETQPTVCIPVTNPD